MEYEYEGTQEYGGRVLWGRIAFFGATLVLVFFLGRCTTASGVPPTEVQQLKDQVAQLSEQKTRLEDQLAAAQTGADNPLVGASERESDGAADQDTPSASDGDSDGPKASGGLPAGSKLYTVKDGDYLTKIAEEVYGDSTPERIKAITDANNLVRGTPLKVGQELIIPPDPGKQ